MEPAASAPLSARIQRLLGAQDSVRAGRFKVEIVKSRLMTEAFQASEGRPQVIRCAKALAHVLDNVPVFIEPEDILIGNFASKPGAVELSCLWAKWSDSELDALTAGGLTVSEADRPEIARMNAYWSTRSLTSRMTDLYDEERLWPYAQLGVVLPAFRSREEGWGPGGMIGNGWGIHHEISQIIGVFQYDKVLARGLDDIIAEAERELSATHITSAASIGKIDLLRAIIISCRAVIRFANRLADEATRMAASEADPARRAELLVAAERSRRVPAQPAESFMDAMQSLWFMVLVVLPAGILSYGRLDQLLYPYYERDREAGMLDQAQILEVLQWLRIKDTQIVITSGSTHRSKYGGLAKWHNLVVGGQNSNGADATNPLSYLILEAALGAPVPHPTLTMRVHEGTPEPLMQKALQLIGAGLGLPAFLGDKSCIEYLQSQGVPLGIARDYAVGGCLGINIPGRSRMIASPMFSVPLVFDFALRGGIDTRTGNQVGPKTKPLAACETFDEFKAAFEEQLAHFIALQAQFNNITIFAYGERFPQPIESMLTEGGIGAGQNILGRTLLYENGSAINPIGMINVADSLAAVRRLVFADKSATGAELMAALESNWEGRKGAALRERAMAAPKYGNDDDEADELAVDLYRFFAEQTETHTTSYGGRHKPAAITIGTANIAGGSAVGASPEGRFAGEPLADESMTPMRGRDKKGPLSALKSALKINQAQWQATSLDMRFTPEAFLTAQGRTAISGMIRSYFADGGKHIQFNVVTNETLRAAQNEPNAYRDLIVRIGGCSAYFCQLAPDVQHEIISRTEYTCVA